MLVMVIFYTYIFFTMGFSSYNYMYDDKSIAHDETNNPHGITGDITVNNVFVKLYCGF